VEVDDADDDEVKEENDDVENDDVEEHSRNALHKSHFIRKLTGKIPRPSWSTLIKHRSLHSHRKKPSVWTLFTNGTNGRNGMIH